MIPVLFAFLGRIPWRIVAQVAVVAGVCLGAYLGYRHVENLRIALEDARTSAEAAKNALAGERQAVQDLRGEFERVATRQATLQAALDALSAQQASHQEAVNKLSRTFARHNLRALADEKPELVERRINDGTAAAVRLRMEAGTIDSGSRTR